MKTLALLAVALVALGGLVSCTEIQPPNASSETGVVSSPPDEAAVRATVAAFANTWNDHDMKGMRELVAEDLLWILRNGNVWRGKKQVCESYASIHRGMSAKHPLYPLSIEKMEVRFLAPQLAVATARMRFGQESEESHTRDTFVMANRGGAWTIVHFHSTPINTTTIKIC